MPPIGEDEDRNLAAAFRMGAAQRGGDAAKAAQCGGRRHHHPERRFSD